MKNASELKNYSIFRKTGLLNLHRSLKELLNCEVNIEENSIDEFSNYIGIDLTENKKRYAYVISDDKVVLSIKIIAKPEIIALLPILLEGKSIGKMQIGYLEKISSAVSLVLSECYENHFRGGERLFYDYLLERIIHLCFGRGEFNADRFSFIIQYLKKLCLTTFENDNFTTGFIITNSAHDYVKENMHSRKGIMYPLSDSHDLFKYARPDRRMWYLADGVSSFYLMDHSLVIKNLYVIPQKKNMVDSWSEYSMDKILWGSDIAFRVINHNQISIMNSDGIEFISIENTWKLRDYSIVHSLFSQNTSMNSEVISCILYYILDCSRNNKSVIIWIPSDFSQEAIETVLIGCKKTFKLDINILDERNEQIVKRIITSDGVTVIHKDGKIIYNGCVVNLSKLPYSKKLVGTGESATRLLAENGVAVKISQDGNVKIYYAGDMQPYIF